MDITILPPAPTAPLPELSELIAETERAKTYGRAAKSGRTRDEYARDWADFLRYCQPRRLESLPADPQTVALYASSLAGRLKISTIRRRMVAIAQVHAERELESPTHHKLVREVLAGIANTHGSARTQKTALTLELLQRALPTGDQLRAVRDRALLLLGFAAALRRSELAALDMTDFTFDERGLTVTLRRSKTDQAGEGRQIAIPYVRGSFCAVRAVEYWLEVAGITDGAAFRSFALPKGRGATPALQTQPISGRDVARIVQRAMQRAGVAGDFAAHSLRAGFVTSAAQKRVPEVDIARVTGHKSVAVLREYVRKATLFDDAPLTTIFE